VNDDTISRCPICGSSDLVLVTELKGVDHSQDFVELTTGRSGVGQSQTDLLCWVDNVDGSDSEWDTVNLIGNAHQQRNDSLMRCSGQKLTPSSPSWSNLVRRAYPESRGGGKSEMAKERTLQRERELT